MTADFLFITPFYRFVSLHETWGNDDGRSGGPDQEIVTLAVRRATLLQYEKAHVSFVCNL
jgi:hypothetical protein